MYGTVQEENGGVDADVGVESLDEGDDRSDKETLMFSSYSLHERARRYLCTEEDRAVLEGIPLHVWTKTKYMNYEDTDTISAEILFREVSREDGKKGIGRGSTRRVGD
ncbi:hypothetical protein BOTCAL_0620g00020 [Botryotinia calthae]|uniref:Uncharacterized protein n=1 Tax=Botryotinia calthae TaxID=38488 RepID=A0A4Y8CJC6_9HELO|nr:hypothetical protein BOTCAL_0620g00020 [Botryotinia calthae]